MIKPATLWGLMKSCDNDQWIGRICRALGGQDVDLDYGQQQMVNSIKMDSGWMDERIEAQRERWRERDRRRRDREKREIGENGENSRLTQSHDTSIHPSVHPSIQEELHSHTRAREDKPELRQVLNTATATMGVPEYYARWWYAEMTARGWLNTDGTAVGTHNWRPTLKAWFNIEKPKHLAEIREAASAAEKREIKVSAKDWTLCEERCANCTNGKCARGIRIPPELEKRPPEECKGFLPKDQS